MLSLPILFPSKAAWKVASDIRDSGTPVSSNRAKQFASIYWRGMTMGAADVIPGVSGGTIALISGIYSRLVFALGSIRPSLFKRFFHLWKQQGPGKAVAETWQAVDGSFLLALLAGIFSSIVLLAEVISTGLNERPVWIWSLFFGLILSSIVYLVLHLFSDYRSESENRFHWSLLFAFIVAGSVIAWWLTHIPPSEWAANEISLWAVFFSASIAMCAMILPGISGSFILLLLGMYQPVLQGVVDGDGQLIMAFACGGIIGLLLFVQLLKWLLEHYYAAVMALMVGFLCGSLNKVWPWKETLSFRVSRSGDLMPSWQVNVWPSDYFSATAGYSDIQGALFFGVLGLLMGSVLVVAGRRYEKRKQEG
jgi:putative membrane protein